MGRDPYMYLKSTGFKMPVRAHGLNRGLRPCKVARITDLIHVKFRKKPDYLPTTARHFLLVKALYVPKVSANIYIVKIFCNNKRQNPPLWPDKRFAVYPVGGIELLRELAIPVSSELEVLLEDKTNFLILDELFTFDVTNVKFYE